MQLSIYYEKDDKYLIELVDRLSNSKRMSKSAAILTILEEYFEADKRVGQILKDMTAINKEQLNRALDEQKQENGDKKLGEIMIENNFIEEEKLERALQIQKERQIKRKTVKTKSKSGGEM